MAKYKITGKKTLNGEIEISGRKNSALKLIAASLLSDKTVIIHRVPLIGDVLALINIIEEMGAEVKIEGNTLQINAANLRISTIPASGKKLRASIVLVGPLLSRFGRAEFPHPGGCYIGKRTIEPHLRAFKALGATVCYEQESYIVEAHHLVGTEIYLKEKSVTGTENAIMAAVRANGTTTIYNCAEESHISNLCDLLRLMGFEISGDGTSTIIITGKPEISTKEAEISVIADEIEIGTFAVAAVITGGQLKLNKVGPKKGLLPILSKFDDINIQYELNESEDYLTIYPSPNLKAMDIQTNPWPGFPSDLQSPFTVLATQLKGTTLVHDWMFEGRLYFVALLQQMGAQIVICDPHRVLVTGPTPLHRNTLITPDLRAGAALILAALCAEGTSMIEHAEMIDRGYDKIDEKLRLVGADIERID